MNATTNDLIRNLSRRQWLVSLTVVVLAITSLMLAAGGFNNDGNNAEVVNLAGRQRMLSQRMALFLTMSQRELNEKKRADYLALATSAVQQFEQGHVRLVAVARAVGNDSPLHTLYFGPAGGADADSQRYLLLVKSAISAAARTLPADPNTDHAIIDAAATGLIKQLDAVAMVCQREDEQKEVRYLRLLQVSTFLIVSLMLFGWIRVFRPAIARLMEDTVARDRVERELNESKERFQAFSQSSSDWMWQTDTWHRFVWFENGREFNFPLSKDRLLGRMPQELMSATDLAEVEKWTKHLADLDARRSFRDFECQLIADDERLLWISVNGQPYCDEHGQFLGYRGTARVIQDQKDIEAANRRLQLAIEQSPVSIMITDGQTRITYVNAHFSEVSGYAADEAVGKTPKIVWSGETPDAVFADMRQALEQGKTWRGEVCNRSKRGDLYWVSQSVASVKNHHGQITHYVAVSEDITEQKRVARREQGRHQILESIARGGPVDVLLGGMASLVEAEFPGGIFTVLRLDRSSGRLYSAFPAALSASYQNDIDGLQIGEKVGSCGAAAFTGKRVVVADIETHPYWKGFRELAAAEGLRACWSQPILASAGTVLGTLAIYYRVPREPTADELKMIEMMSSLAAICLEREEAEVMLQQQQAATRQLLAEHQTILNNALVGIVYLKQRQIISCNRRLEQIFGYGPGELIGLTTEVFYSSRELFDSTGEQAYRVIADGSSFSTEVLLKHKDGTYFHGALTGCAVDPQHPHDGSIWVYADISERRQAEDEAHKLLQAVEQSPVSIVITNREGLIEYVNPRFTLVSGYSQRDAVGQNPRLLQSGETPLATYQHMWSTLKAGKEWRGILRNRRKSGELFWEEASISPILNETGETTHFVAVKEDITERKRIEDELDQHRTHLESLVTQRTADLTRALEAARVAEQAKDAFLANMSHELRTPLNAVIGMANLAHGICNDPKPRAYLEKIVSSGKHLSRIINDLLDLSKIAAGHMEMETIAFSLSALLERCSAVMQPRVDEKGLRLTAVIDPAVPDVLLGDPLRIEQILLNLVGNAVKFTAKGRIDIRIALRSREDGRVFVAIEVEDSGVGMGEADLQRLFVPFSQADASVSRKFGGTGLGLAISRRLAEIMGGDISVRSREGVGTTFCVLLWLGAQDGLSLPDNTPEAGADLLPVSYEDARVLVVDDQPLNREIVEALLEQVGIVPRMAGNGQQALDLISEAGPQGLDLVLMDIQMPGKDGLSATRELRAWDGYVHLPVIAMTAHTMEHQKDLAAQAGMNGHIGKPFETAHFFKLLAQWIPLAKHRYQQAVPLIAADTAATGFAAMSSVDTQGALSRFGGRESRYLHWLQQFLADAPGYAAQLREQLAAGDAEAAAQFAHAMRGRVGTLGMTGLYPVVSALENAINAGDLTAPLLDQLHQAITTLCAEIRNGLGQAATADESATAPIQLPAGPRPGSIVKVLGMLKSADGECSGAIERALAELHGTGWEPALRQALQHLLGFDFDAAYAVLTADGGE